MEKITLFSSHGTLIITPDGEVLDRILESSDPDEVNYLQDIVHVNTSERKWWHKTHNPFRSADISRADIVDFGVWFKSGEYMPPSREHRKIVYGQPILLVDSHHGVYSWQILFERNKDFISTDRFSLKLVEQEDLDVILAGPDHEDYWDVVADLTTHGIWLFCKEPIQSTGQQGIFYIEQDEDIWATHPDFPFLDPEELLED